MKDIFQRSREYEREVHQEEYQELLMEEERMEALEMLEEMRKARGEEDAD